jgi:hypothetical protein
MRELLNYANGYIRKMNVSDIAMLKACLCSLGLLAGLAIPKKHKKKAAGIAATTFAFTYAPLMTKLLVTVLEESKKQN